MTWTSNDLTGIASHYAFDSCSNERRMSANQRHRLALHVRSHESAVSVVMLQERNQRSSDRNQLIRRHVHQFDFVRIERERNLPLRRAAIKLSRQLASSRASGATCAIILFSSSVAVKNLMSSVTSYRLIPSRYGVSMKPNSLTRAYVDRDAIRPMFGPSGVSIGQIRP